MTDAAPDDRLLELEIEKHRLECEKLRAEIAEVRQPLWKRSGYIASLSPMIIAVVAFFSAWISGYFDNARKVLETEVSALKAEVTGLETRRTDLTAENETLQASVKGLGAKVDELTALRDRLAAQNAALQAQIDDSFITMKVIAGEASYALSLFHAFDIDTRVKDAVEATDETSIPESIRTLLGDIVIREQNLDEILKVAEEELARLDASLKDLPSSPWTKSLRYLPHPDGPFLFTPKDRVYDVGRGLFYDDLDAWEANRPSARQKDGP